MKAPILEFGHTCEASVEQQEIIEGLARLAGNFDVRANTYPPRGSVTVVFTKNGVGFPPGIDPRLWECRSHISAKEFIRRLAYML